MYIHVMRSCLNNQNTIMQDQNKSKIEFFVNTTDKIRFVELCQQHSYKMAEIMRRAFEEKMEWLEKKGLSK